MRRPRTHPTSISAVVRTIVGRQEGSASGQRGGKTLRVFEAFARIGPPISERAEPVAFKNGVLTLEVEQSVWLTELSLLAPHIRERLNQGLRNGWVKRVRLRLGLPRKRRIHPALRPLTQAEHFMVERWVGNIRNPDVQEAVRRAAARSVCRGLSRTGILPGPAGPCVTPENPIMEPPALTYGYGRRRPAGSDDAH